MEFQGALSDEFNGTTLDRTKWEPFNRNWKGRAPGWFCEDNVFVKDGCLNLISKLQSAPAGYPSQYGNISTSFVRSKEQVLYGRFEALVEPGHTAISSAFWLVHNKRESWNEIDIFEISQGEGHEKKYHMNAHVFRKAGKNLDKVLSHPSWVELNRKTCDKPLIASLEWTPEHLLWMVDGYIVRSMKNEHWHEPMWIQLDCETMGNWFGLPAEGDLNEADPPRFKVHYIRTWKLRGL